MNNVQTNELPNIWLNKGARKRRRAPVSPHVGAKMEAADAAVGAMMKLPGILGIEVYIASSERHVLNLKQACLA